MKREEMTKVMRMKIIESALQEFNDKSYEKASMNHICQIGNISKGIIYHYFKDKDELYLECV
ncbi:MAG: TetR/AcrR family transcriptional regulator, partial [Longibaculum sp.]